MELDEYLEARNQVIDAQYRYAAYKHTADRLWQRFNIPRNNFRMFMWEKKSFDCARRQFGNPIIKDEHANFFRDDYFRNDVIWVYNRKQRCIVSVYTLDILTRKHPDIARNPWKYVA